MTFKSNYCVNQASLGFRAQSVLGSVQKIWEDGLLLCKRRILAIAVVGCFSDTTSTPVHRMAASRGVPGADCTYPGQRRDAHAAFVRNCEYSHFSVVGKTLRSMELYYW